MKFKKLPSLQFVITNRLSLISHLNWNDRSIPLTYDRNNSITLNVNFLFLVVPDRLDGGLFCTFLRCDVRARICKRIRSTGIDSKESIPPTYVAWRAGTSNRVVVLARQAGNRFLGPWKGLQIRALATIAIYTVGLGGGGGLQKTHKVSLRPGDKTGR